MNNIEQKIDAAKSQAQKKNAKDIYERGLNYYNAEDYQNATECFRKAAEMGHAEAQFVWGAALLGEFPLNDMLGDEDLKEIVTAKDTSSWFNINFSKLGINPNPEDAFDWLLKSAEQEYSWGEILYGFIASAVDGNGEEILNDFTKAAEQGNMLAMMMLFQAYSEGKLGECHIKKDENKAVFWLGKLAEQGVPGVKEELEAMIQEIFQQGLNFSKQENHQEAVKCFRKAAEMGHAEAQCYMGIAYFRGEGVEKNYQKSVEWYRKSAGQGFARAQRNLGVRYMDGEGVEQNYTTAAKWFLKAAEQGDAEAQYRLGNCYYLGEGLENDEQKAVEWFRKAASQGHEQAKTALEFATESSASSSSKSDAEDTLASAAAGATIGAAVGSVIPIVGTAVGAAIGGLLGGIFGKD